MTDGVDEDDGDEDAGDEHLSPFPSRCCCNQRAPVPEKNFIQEMLIFIIFIT